MTTCTSCGTDVQHPEDYDNECPECGGLVEEEGIVNRMGELVYGSGYQSAAGYPW